MQAKDFTSKGEYGVILGNPPYGERIGDKKAVEELYRDLGKTYQN